MFDITWIDDLGDFRGESANSLAEARKLAKSRVCEALKNNRPFRSAVKVQGPGDSVIEHWSCERVSKFKAVKV